MTWVKFDDAFDEHDKVEALLEEDELRGLAAIGLLTLLCTNSARKMTDGRVSARTLRALAPDEQADLAARLERAGLLDRDGDGLAIHDYLDRNPSRDEILDRRAKRAAAGAQGGRAKARRLASASGDASADARAGADPAATDGVATPVPVPVPLDPPYPPEGGRKRDRETFLEGMKAWAEAHFPEEDSERVRLIADRLRGARREVTVESVRARLEQLAPGAV